MEVGALIVAAGMSSRMGEFKPMLNIGTISIAQRIVATFNRSGVNKVVMVTGYNAVTLERHLAGNGIIFLRNENYETTQMFDSVKIGLRYLQNKWGAVHWPMQPNSRNCASRPMMTSKAACGLRLTKAESAYD